MSVPSVEEVMEALHYAACVLDAHALWPDSNMLTQHTATKHAVTLAAHRERLKAEREFVEAALAYNEKWAKQACAPIGAVCVEMIVAYKALAPSEEKAP